MSRPKYYWYNAVRSMIMHSKRLYADDSERATQLQKAIEEAKEETLRLPIGNDRLTAIDDILFKQIRTPEGEALKLNYGKRTIDRWISAFIICVGRKAGY